MTKTTIPKIAPKSKRDPAQAATPAVSALPGDDAAETLVPLSRLFRDPLNVRKKKAGANVGELAATILSHGLLQNLTVRAEVKKGGPTGRFGVVAGGRRLDALALLVGGGRLATTYPVRCRVVGDERAIDVSLAENSGREDLHGADLLDAFVSMKAQGRTVEQIADAWGLAPLTVQRRLRLADMAPELLDLYRNDGITADQLMALSIIDDRAVQWQTWCNLSPWERSTNHIRQIVTRQDMSTQHPAVRFVGLGTYKKAGGAVRVDLFSDEKRAGGTIADPALMLALAAEKLAERAPKVTGDGWTWIDSKVDFELYREKAYVAPRMCRRDPTADETAEMSALQQRLADLEAQADGADADGALAERIDELYEQIEDFHARLSTTDPRDATLVGVVVSLDRDGKPQISQPLVRVADRAAAAIALPKASAGGANDGEEPRAGAAGAVGRPAFSDALTHRLTCHRTIAMRATLARSPRVALRVLAFQLARLTLVDAAEAWAQDRSTIELRATVADVARDVPDMAASPAFMQIEADRAVWRSTLPSEDDALLQWCLRADDETIGRLLAFGTAQCVNAIYGKTTREPRPLADALARAVKLDMRQWWSATGDSFLAAVPKAKLIEAVTEAVSPEAAGVLVNKKKAEAVVLAERALCGKGWLPAPLRLAA